MQTFCTIITTSHLPFAKVLLSSLQKHVPNTKLQVLVVDNKEIPTTIGLSVYSLNDFIDFPLFKEIENKYAHTNTDHFRWALKPLFISFLLKNGFSKVIFADADLYFVNDFSFLFEELNNHNVILTPHWANMNPLENEDSLFTVLREGIFNAGFIGASISGREAIDWWAKMCHYKIEKRKELGLYDDQKYLDLLPVQFPKVFIIKHQGCNLASWNIDTCKRELKNGKLLINSHFEPVFIHFAKDTILNILNKNDVLLKPTLDEYINELAKENFDLIKSLNILNHSTFNSMMYSVKHKLLVRTRLKRFLFKLAEKL